MRTTLSIDDDVAALLDQEVRRSGASYKTTVNRLLRLGMMAAQQQPLDSFVVTPLKIALPPGTNPDNIEDVLDQLEGPGRR